MKLKKVLSLLLSAAVMISTITVPQIKSSAIHGVDSDPIVNASDRGTITYKYLGRSSTVEGITSVSQLTQRDSYDYATNGWEEGNYLWVGVQLSNLGKVKSVFHRDGGEDGKGGLNTFISGIAFDNRYFEWDPNTSSDTYALSCVQPIFDEDQGYDDYVYSNEINSNTFTLTVDANGNGDSTLPLSLSGIKNSTDNITVGKEKVAVAEDSMGAEVPRWNQLDDESVDDTAPYTLLAFALKMKDIEDQPEPKGDLVQGYLNSVYSVLSVGFGTDVEGYSFDVEHERVDTATQVKEMRGDNIYNYFNVTDNALVQGMSFPEDTAAYNLTAAGNYRANVSIENKSATNNVFENLAANEVYKATVTSGGDNTKKLSSWGISPSNGITLTDSSGNPLTGAALTEAQTAETVYFKITADTTITPTYVDKEGSTIAVLLDSAGVVQGDTNSAHFNATGSDKQKGTYIRTEENKNYTVKLIKKDYDFSKTATYQKIDSNGNPIAGETANIKGSISEVTSDTGVGMIITPKTTAATSADPAGTVITLTAPLMTALDVDGTYRITFNHNGGTDPYIDVTIADLGTEFTDVKVIDPGKAEYTHGDRLSFEGLEFVLRTAQLADLIGKTRSGNNDVYYKYHDKQWYKYKTAYSASRKWDDAWYTDANKITAPPAEFNIVKFGDPDNVIIANSDIKYDGTESASVMRHDTLDNGTYKTELKITPVVENAFDGTHATYPPSFPGVTPSSEISLFAAETFATIARTTNSPYTVAKKALNVVIGIKQGETISQQYAGNTDQTETAFTQTNVNKLTYSYDESELTAGDTKDKVKLVGVGTPAIKGIHKGTYTAAANQLTAPSYSTISMDGDLGSNYTVNNTSTISFADGFTADITPRLLKVRASVPKEPVGKYKVGDTVTLDAANYKFDMTGFDFDAADDPTNDDDVHITGVTYQYFKDDQDTAIAADGTVIPVGNNYKAKLTVATDLASLASTAYKDDYAWDASQPNGVFYLTAEITGETIKSISAGTPITDNIYHGGALIAAGTGNDSTKTLPDVTVTWNDDTTTVYTFDKTLNEGAGGWKETTGGTKDVTFDHAKGSGLLIDYDKPGITNKATMADRTYVLLAKDDSNSNIEAAQLSTLTVIPRPLTLEIVSTTEGEDVANVDKNKVYNGKEAYENGNLTYKLDGVQTFDQEDNVVVDDQVFALVYKNASTAATTPASYAGDKVINVKTTEGLLTGNATTLGYYELQPIADVSGAKITALGITAKSIVDADRKVSGDDIKSDPTDASTRGKAATNGVPSEGIYGKLTLGDGDVIPDGEEIYVTYEYEYNNHTTADDNTTKVKITDVKLDTSVDGMANYTLTNEVTSEYQDKKLVMDQIAGGVEDDLKAGDITIKMDGQIGDIIYYHGDTLDMSKIIIEVKSDSGETHEYRYSAVSGSPWDKMNFVVRQGQTPLDLTQTIPVRYDLATEIANSTDRKITYNVDVPLDLIRVPDRVTGMGFRGLELLATEVASVSFDVIVKKRPVILTGADTTNPVQKYYDGTSSVDLNDVAFTTKAQKVSPEVQDENLGILTIDQEVLNWTATTNMYKLNNAEQKDATPQSNDTKTNFKDMSIAFTDLGIENAPNSTPDIAGCYTFSQGNITEIANAGTINALPIKINAQPAPIAKDPSSSPVVAVSTTVNDGVVNFADYADSVKFNKSGSENIVYTYLTTYASSEFVQGVSTANKSATTSDLTITSANKYNFAPTFVNGQDTYTADGSLIDYTITALEITQDPKQTDYQYGDRVDLTGMKVKATLTYGDNSTEEKTYERKSDGWYDGNTKVVDPFTVSLGNNDNITKLGTVTATTAQPEGKTSLIVTAGTVSKTKENVIKVSKKDLILNIEYPKTGMTKVYDNSNVFGTLDTLTEYTIGYSQSLETGNKITDPENGVITLEGLDGESATVKIAEITAYTQDKNASNVETIAKTEASSDAFTAAEHYALVIKTNGGNARNNLVKITKRPIMITDISIDKVVPVSSTVKAEDDVYATTDDNDDTKYKLTVDSSTPIANNDTVTVKFSYTYGSNSEATAEGAKNIKITDIELETDLLKQNYEPTFKVSSDGINVTVTPAPVTTGEPSSVTKDTVSYAHGDELSIDDLTAQLNGTSIGKYIEATELWTKNGLTVSISADGGTNFTKIEKKSVKVAGEANEVSKVVYADGTNAGLPVILNYNANNDHKYVLRVSGLENGVVALQGTENFAKVGNEYAADIEITVTPIQLTATASAADDIKKAYDGGSALILDSNNKADGVTVDITGIKSSHVSKNANDEIVYTADDVDVTYTADYYADTAEGAALGAKQINASTDNANAAANLDIGFSSIAISGDDSAAYTAPTAIAKIENKGAIYKKTLTATAINGITTTVSKTVKTETGAKAASGTEGGDYPYTITFNETIPNNEVVTVTFDYAYDKNDVVDTAGSAVVTVSNTVLESGKAVNDNYTIVTTNVTTAAHKQIGKVTAYTVDNDDSASKTTVYYEHGSNLTLDDIKAVINDTTLYNKSVDNENLFTKNNIKVYDLYGKTGLENDYSNIAAVAVEASENSIINWDDSENAAAEAIPAADNSADFKAVHGNNQTQRKLNRTLVVVIPQNVNDLRQLELSGAADFSTLTKTLNGNLYVPIQIYALKKQITASATGTTEKFYDAGTEAAAADFNVTYNITPTGATTGYTASYADKDASETAKNVTLVFAVTGDKADNYIKPDDIVLTSAGTIKKVKLYPTTINGITTAISAITVENETGNATSGTIGGNYNRTVVFDEKGGDTAAAENKPENTIATVSGAKEVITVTYNYSYDNNDKAVSGTDAAGKVTINSIALDDDTSDKNVNKNYEIVDTAIKANKQSGEVTPVNTNLNDTTSVTKDTTEYIHGDTLTLDNDLHVMMNMSSYEYNDANWNANGIKVYVADYNGETQNAARQVVKAASGKIVYADANGDATDEEVILSYAKAKTTGRTIDLIVELPQRVVALSAVSVSGGDLDNYKATIPLTISKANLRVTMTYDTTKTYEKTYDKTTAYKKISEIADNVSFAANYTDASLANTAVQSVAENGALTVTGRVAGDAIKVDLSKLTANTAVANVTNNGTKLDKANLKKAEGWISGNESYNVEFVVDNEPNAVIKPFALKVTEITNIPKAEVSTTPKTGENTASGITGQTTGTAVYAAANDGETMPAGDTVGITYTYTYASNSDSTAAAPAVTIGNTITSDNLNYTVANAVTNATGKVDEANVTSFDADKDVKTYVHGAALDLNDIYAEINGVKMYYKNADGLWNKNKLVLTSGGEAVDDTNPIIVDWYKAEGAVTGEGKDAYRVFKTFRVAQPEKVLALAASSEDPFELLANGTDTFEVLVTKKAIDAVTIAANPDSTLDKIYDGDADVPAEGYILEAVPAIDTDKIELTATVQYLDETGAPTANAGEDAKNISFTAPKLAGESAANQNGAYYIADNAEITKKNADDDLKGTIDAKVIKVTSAEPQPVYGSEIEESDTDPKSVTKELSSVVLDDETFKTGDGKNFKYYGTYTVNEDDETKADVAFSYEGDNTNYKVVFDPASTTVTMLEKKVKNITADKGDFDPNVTYGDEFDPTGLKVTVDYTDNTSETYTYKTVDGTKGWYDSEDNLVPNDDIQFTTKWADDPNTTTFVAGDKFNVFSKSGTGISVIPKDAEINVTAPVKDEDGNDVTITIGAKPVTVTFKGKVTKAYDRTSAAGDYVTKDNYTIDGLLDNDKDVTLNVVAHFVDASNEETFNASVPAYTAEDGTEAAAFGASKYVVDSAAVAAASANEPAHYAVESYSYDNTIEGEITKRLIHIKTANIGTVSRSQTDAETTVSNSSNFTAADGEILADENDTKDVVTISYKAKYTSSGASVTAAEIISDITVDGDAIQKNNYSAVAADDIAVTGSVSGGGGGGGGGTSNSLVVKVTDPTTGTTTVVSSTGIKGVEGSKTTLSTSFTAYMKDTSVTWTSSDESIVTVDEDGNVTFIAPGNAVITAVSNGNSNLKKTFNVEVTEADITSATDAPEATTEPSGGNRPTNVTFDYKAPYVNGYEDGSFGPEKSITREEVATMFARILQNSLEMDKAYDASFSDVTAENWSKDYIGYLESYAIVNGYEDGTFKPKASITRAEMAVMIARLEKIDFENEGTETMFNDIADIYDSWATPAIKALSEMGIITGYEDGSFRPAQPITRAETVTMINRMINAGEVEEIKVRPTDVTDVHWAWTDIIKSMNDRITSSAADSSDVSKQAAEGEDTEATASPETTESPEGTPDPNATPDPDATASPEATPSASGESEAEAEASPEPTATVKPVVTPVVLR